jgi:hypothetical protein
MAAAARVLAFCEVEEEQIEGGRFVWMEMEVQALVLGLQGPRRLLPLKWASKQE